LYSTPEQQQVCVAARTEKAGANFRVRSMPVLSFRSYVNSLAYLFKVSDRTTAPIVPSSVSQFPKFNAFFKPLLTKALGGKAVGWQGDPSNTVLTEEELILVVGTVEEKRILDVQRRYVLCLGFSTAYRAEVLKKLSRHSGASGALQLMFARHPFVDPHICCQVSSFFLFTRGVTFPVAIL
jgi:hypothetical protein